MVHDGGAHVSVGGSDRNRIVSDLVKDGIMACKKQLASTHRMPPLIYIFDAVNNFGYHNATEFHLKADDPQDREATPRISMSELTAISEMPEMPQ